MIKKEKIAIFIDAANFEISLKSCNLFADYKKLLGYAQSFGTPIILRYYCDFVIKKAP